MNPSSNYSGSSGSINNNTMLLNAGLNSTTINSSSLNATGTSIGINNFCNPQTTTILSSSSSTGSSNGMKSVQGTSGGFSGSSSNQA